MTASPFTELQRRVVYKALQDYQFETKRYLQSMGMGGRGGSHSPCCEFQARNEERDEEIRKALTQRMNTILEAIALIQRPGDPT